MRPPKQKPTQPTFALVGRAAPRSRRRRRRGCRPRRAVFLREHHRLLAVAQVSELSAEEVGAKARKPSCAKRSAMRRVWSSRPHHSWMTMRAGQGTRTGGQSQVACDSSELSMYPAKISDPRLLPARRKSALTLLSLEVLVVIARHLAVGDEDCTGESDSSQPALVGSWPLASA